MPDELILLKINILLDIMIIGVFLHMAPHTQGSFLTHTQSPYPHNTVQTVLDTG